MPRSPFASWRSDLQQRGFVSTSTGGRRGTYMVRRTGAVGQAIGVMLHLHRGREFAIVLHVTMPLRCAEPPYDVVLLSGDVGREGVRIDGPRSHLEPGSATWWTLDELDTAWDAVRRHGIEWLERFGAVDALVAHFEAAVSRRRESVGPEPKRSLLQRVARRLSGASSPAENSIPNDYHLFMTVAPVDTDAVRLRNQLVALSFVVLGRLRRCSCARPESDRRQPASSSRRRAGCGGFCTPRAQKSHSSHRAW